MPGACVTMATLKTVEQLTEEWAPAIRKAFLDAIYAIRDRVVVGDVVDALRRGDIEGAVRAVGLDPAAFRGVDAAISQAFEAGGSGTTGSMPAVRNPEGRRLLVLFDVRNPSAENWLRDHSATLVREVVADQVKAIRTHLEAGMAKGENPRTTALDLVGRINPTTKKREGGVIGLTATQEAWVKNYADELANLKPGALDRAMRDKRFDRTVQKAIATGTPLSPEQQVAMVAAYRTRALKHRAEMLARTEAMTALNQSQFEAVQQGINKGVIAERHVTKTWKTGLDKRVRHTHRQMHNQKVGLRESFVSPSGAKLRYPGDPEAPAEERVGCRCWQEIKVDFVAMEVERKK